MNSLPFDWQSRSFGNVHVSSVVLEGLRHPGLSDDNFPETSRAAARPGASERTRLRVDIDARVARA